MRKDEACIGVMRRSWTWGRGVFASTLLILAAGCQSIPDVTPWSEATKAVAVGVTEGFRTAARVNGDIAGQLESIKLRDSSFAETADQYAKVATGLREGADRYEIVFGAISDYANSLAAIAKAANSSQDTVDGIAGSLNGLLDAVGVAKMSGPAFDLGKALATEAIRIRAAHDFAEAVSRADPTIEQLGKVVQSDLDSLGATVGVTKDTAIRVALELPLRHEVEYYEKMVKRREEKMGLVGDIASKDPLVNNESAVELATVEKYLAQADSWHGPLETRIEEALANRRAVAELITQTSRAVDAWVSSHRSLAAAVQQKRLPESARLMSLATRIQDLMADLKSHRKDR